MFKYLTALALVVASSSFALANEEQKADPSAAQDPQTQQVPAEEQKAQ
jgi:hypothetical protein